jgi:hypothetical protein
MTRSRKASLCVLVVVLLASCGGGSKTVDPKTYVHSVCGAILDWVNAAKQNSSQLQQITPSGSTAADAKAALGKYIDNLIAETGAALDKLKAAGVPDVPNGDSVRTAFVDSFQSVQAAFTKARQTISTLPTSSRTAFQSATQKLGATLQTSLQGIGSSLNKIGQDPTLVKASNDDPSCQQLGSL